MLDKTRYSSWASRMLLYIKGKENGKLLVDSVLNRPFKYGTVTEPGTTTTPITVRDRRYDELTDAEKIHEAYDIKATNIRPVLLLTSQQLYDVPMIQQRSYQAPVANHSLVAHHQSYQASDVHQPPQALFPRMDSGLVVLSFLPFEDPIVSLNKAIAFINTIFTSQYPPTNNQLRTSSNPHNQATIRDGRVMVQIVQGRQTQGYTCSGARSNATMTGFNRNGGTNIAAWFKEKAMLAKALESGVVLDEEHMAFLADNGDTVTTAPSTSVVLMAKLSSYDSATLSEVPMHDNYLDNHVIDQNVQEMQYYEQPIFNNDTDIDLTSESNMISYEQYLKETENTVVQDTSSAQQEEMRMFVIEKMNNQVVKSNEMDKENKIINKSLTAELERYKEQIK
ncbi:hypothetical protein Tco_0434428 [Tanacetum coccineum]